MAGIRTVATAKAALRKALALLAAAREQLADAISDRVESVEDVVGDVLRTAYVARITR
jgi:hypothetical protein